MRILVLGLGALGTVYSCLLKMADHQVWGIDVPAIALPVSHQGVHIQGIWGKGQACLDQVATSVEELNSLDFDLIIVTVKSYHTAEASQNLAPCLQDNTLVLLAQNGYGNYEAASPYIPSSQLILGRVMFGAVAMQPGHSQVTVIADDVLLGHPYQLVAADKLQELAEMFRRAGLPTRVSPNIMEAIWAKIIYNSALNPLGAILEVPYGQLAEMKWSREMMEQIITEIFEVLKALKQSTLWPDAEAYKNAFYGQMLPSTAAHRASMLQDIQQGRKTEIDALNGAVVMLGTRLGVETPVNRIIASLLKCKEDLGFERGSFKI